MQTEDLWFIGLGAISALIGFRTLSKGFGISIAKIRGGFFKSFFLTLGVLALFFLVSGLVFIALLLLWFFIVFGFVAQ